MRAAPWAKRMKKSNQCLDVRAVKFQREPPPLFLGPQEKAAQRRRDQELGLQEARNGLAWRKGQKSLQMQPPRPPWGAGEGGRRKGDFFSFCSSLRALFSFFSSFFPAQTPFLFLSFALQLLTPKSLAILIKMQTPGCALDIENL